MTNFKALCAELVHITNALDGKNALISNQGQAMDGYSALAAFRDVADRARAALAAGSDGPAVPEGREPASVAGEPSDEELLELADGWPATTAPRHDLSGCPEVPLYSVFADEVVEFARAAFARWGHHPAPPAEGEVGELVAALRAEAVHDEINDHMAWLTPADARRAADLLEQRHPAPVPVAERLPSASHVYFEFVISDADDCTQTGGIAPTYAQALSEGQHYLAQYQQDGPHTLELRRVEVLPHCRCLRRR